MVENSSDSVRGGVFRKGDVRLSDLAGRRKLPIGNSNFLTVVESSVFVDKSMLIADVLDGDSSVTLYCRPRRFGKSLNLSMLQRFFEEPSPSDPSACDTTALFEGLAIWDADDGRFREHHQAYPVIRLALNDAKGLTWEDALQALATNIAGEFLRHGYLKRSDALLEEERARFLELASPGADLPATLAQSLGILAGLLHKHHQHRVVILIDEYDAPVMAAHTNGYYDKAVAFLKMWLTSALKDNDALAFACLTGVQRISKESIFSDLNNLTVNTSLNVVSDERYGFTEAEVEALAEYLGAKGSLDAARTWYDGYRFGSIDVYNPWSMLNYFSNGGIPDVYWGNTSGNSVLGDMVRRADERTWEKLYRLMEPTGTVEEALDTSVVFPDIGVRDGALWSMLYLAGYLTTDDTALPGSPRRRRPLRIPNAEIAELYRTEIIERYAVAAGGWERLEELHRTLMQGDAEGVRESLESILLDSASYFDLKDENSYHMLMMGLLFGMPGYHDPLSNREAGRGRFDILLQPCSDGAPIVLELKWTDRCDQRAEDELARLAQKALGQIEDRSYVKSGAIAFGIAFSGKDCAVVSREIR